MAEPDPFGRKQGEDPLAAMGWSDAPAAPAEAAPAAVTTDAASTATAGDAFGVPEQIERARRTGAPAPRRPDRPSRFSIGWLPKLLFFGAVLVVIAAVAIPVVTAVDDAFDTVDDITPSRPERPAGDPAAPRVVEDTGPPRGLRPRSMLLRGNLSPAVGTLRARMGGRLHYVRIEAERVDLQVARGGKLTSAQARWDGEPQVFPGVEANAAGSTFAWSQLDPSAPRRFVRAATRRAGKPSGAFSYAVLMNAAGLRWQVFLRDGTHFVASPDGRRVEKV
jgi:hypothetical protein